MIQVKQSNSFVAKFQRRLQAISPWTAIVLILFILNILLVASVILPGYDEINPFDGSKYIESGRQLIDGGELREISRSPTLALLYGAIYLFVRSSIDWFVLCAGIGNLFLYSFLWFGTYYFGLRFREEFHPILLIGILFVSPVLIIILGNPSDALWAFFSLLAMAKTLDFSRSMRLRDLAWSSVFVGLAFVTRLDGLYLFPLFIVLSFVIGFRKFKLHRLLAAILLPGLVTIGVFYIASGISRGNFSTNYGGIAYGSLQWYGTTDASGTLIGGEEVIETFGTPEENKGSALVAFSHNPRAVINQVIENLKKAPDQILSDYGGKKFTPYFLLFLIAGLFVLIQQKSYRLLILFALWPLNVVLYLPYYTRSGYYLQSFFIPFVLCAMGLKYIFSSARTKGEKIAIMVILGGILIYSIADQKPAFVSVAALSIAMIFLYWLIQKEEPSPMITTAVGLFLALCAGLILRSPFSFPQPWTVGESPAEQAVHFLEEKLDRGDVVGSYVPKPVDAARMTVAPLYGVPIGDQPVEDLRAWIRSTNVKALIVEPNFINSYPEIWNAIELSEGTLLEPPRIFDPGSIQVFVVKQ